MKKSKETAIRTTLLASAILFPLVTWSADRTTTPPTMDTPARDRPAADRTGTTTGTTSAATPTSGAVMTIENVETLMDDLRSHNGKRVSLPGNVARVIRPKVFILEGGGLINDEIVVVTPRNAANLSARVKEDADLTVVGTVRYVPFGDIKRELGLPYDRDVESELARVNAYIVASDISVR